MKSGYAATILAGLAATIVPAVAQTPGGGPSVPASPVERKQVPMGDGTPAPGTTTDTRGSATGLVKTEERPRLLEYAFRHRSQQIKVRDDIGIGSVLPPEASLLDIPPEFGLPRYRLALANQKALLVDPSTRRVEEVLE